MGPKLSMNGDMILLTLELLTKVITDQGKLRTDCQWHFAICHSGSSTLGHECRRPALFSSFRKKALARLRDTGTDRQPASRQPAFRRPAPRQPAFQTSSFFRQPAFRTSSFSDIQLFQTTSFCDNQLFRQPAFCDNQLFVTTSFLWHPAFCDNQLFVTSSFFGKPWVRVYQKWWFRLSNSKLSKAE